jgi:hypothetical protein
MAAGKVMALSSSTIPVSQTVRFESFTATFSSLPGVISSRVKSCCSITRIHTILTGKSVAVGLPDAVEGSTNEEAASGVSPARLLQAET